MCDQLDGRGCEVVEEKDNEIVNLGDEVDYLGSRLFDKENEINTLKITVKDLVDEKLELQQKIDDLEIDIDDINLGGSL